MVFPTHIPKLDELLDGGLRENTSVLLLAQPGVRSLEFAQQLFYNLFLENGSAIYFVNNKLPQAVREQFRSYDWSLRVIEKKKKLVFIDCFSSQISQPSSETYAVEDHEDEKHINDIITKAVKKLPTSEIIFIFDSLSYFFDCVPEAKHIPSLKRMLAIKNMTSIFIFTSWLYPEKLLGKVKQLFDCVIELKAVERKVIVRNYFTVSKASWLGKTQHREIPFKIVKPGGVNVYIPKILVTGPFNAGKTSFIHSASVKAVSVDRLGTTVALDHGKVKYQGILADLFGTPGQERFDPLLEMLGGEALGVIIVVDATNPKSFSRAKEMLQLTHAENLPAVIAANKADLKGALKPDEIREKMKLPKEMPIVSVVAEDLASVKKDKFCQLKKEGVQKVLDTLFEVVV